MSIVYSVTVKPDRDIELAYLDWLQSEHIAEVVSTGCFDSYRFFKVLAEDETDGASYNIQYLTTDMSRYFDYINNFAPLMRSKGREKFGEKFHAFRTVLKQLQ
ncbi:MAG: DUF4286 family protein [Chitinophagales bacterium]|nr:DUF4286 family protein [Chitinophagales bacterium]